MSQAAAASQASQPGRGPDHPPAAGRPEPSRHTSAANPIVARPPRAVPRACATRAAITAALARRLRHHTGRLAAGVTDLSTGVTATYHPRQAFHTASIVKAGILAALLLQRQRQHAAPGPSDQALATAMIETATTTPRPRCGPPSAEPPASPPPTRPCACATPCPAPAAGGG
jgi:beta-lactamase class A